MTEQAKTTNTILLGGQTIGFTPPTQGQIEAMIRISRSTQRATDDSPSDFWVKQIGRVGDLLDSLIDEADRDLVEEMYLDGRIDHSKLLVAILTKVRDDNDAADGKPAVKAKKVTGVRVQRQ